MDWTKEEIDAAWAAYPDLDNEGGQRPRHSLRDRSHLREAFVAGMRAHAATKSE